MVKFNFHFLMLIPCKWYLLLLWKESVSSKPSGKIIFKPLYNYIIRVIHLSLKNMKLLIV